MRLTQELLLTRPDPDFYEDGNPFLVWANQYASPLNESRVIQSAQAFLQGYLYVFAQAYGTVVSINSTGSPDALGRSLGPSDLCPAYTNNPQNNVTDCKLLERTLGQYFNILRG
jgi:acid phosphatase